MRSFHLGIWAVCFAAGIFLAQAPAYGQFRGDSSDRDSDSRRGFGSRDDSRSRDDSGSRDRGSDDRRDFGSRGDSSRDFGSRWGGFGSRGDDSEGRGGDSDSRRDFFCAEVSADPLVVLADLRAVSVDLPVASEVDSDRPEDSEAVLVLQEVLALGAGTTENRARPASSTGSTATVTDGWTVTKCRVPVRFRASWIAPELKKEPAATISPAVSIECVKNPGAKEVTTEAEVPLQAATLRRRRSE